MSIEGRRIGEYHVHRRLGVGGMAEVYAAERRGPAGFRRAVALKVLRPHLLALPSVVERFTREARLAATLRHPNLVPVIDFGVDGEVAYLVMELVDGPDLRRAVVAGTKVDRPLPPELAVHVALQVCRGLGYAHRQTGPDGRPLGLVHRDVSPQNILLSRNGEVRLTDFGIATAAWAAEESASGTLRGKLAYLAPEQAEGGEADPRADLFALGVVLWELLAGRRLFFAATDAETLARVRRCEVPLPPSPVPPEVPEMLWAALAGALARDPAARYDRAETMAAALVAACPEADRGGAARQLAEWLAAVEPCGPQPDREPAHPAGRSLDRSRTRTHGRDGPTPTLELPGSGPDSRPQAGAGGPPGHRPTWRPEPGAVAAGRAGHQGRRRATLAGAITALGAAVLVSLTLSRPSSAPRGAASGAPSRPADPGIAVSQAAGAATGEAAPAAPGLRGPTGSESEPSRQAPGRSRATPGPGVPAPASPAMTPRPTAAMIVASRPAGARIELDGRPVGRTPRRLEGLRPGEPVVIRLHLDGYSPAERTMTPIAGKATTVEFELYPAFGTLSVDAVPWAEVWLDDRYLGATPLFGRRVPAGPHTLRLAHPPSGRNVEVAVYVEPDGEVRRRVVLVPPATPPGSQVPEGLAETRPPLDPARR